ncbi:MAG: helix-turn-helix transcriptional regulator [Candidatus Babeliaceae bacterium]|nr:helix-turn-helix transcriptional regulator [Candidatus Babeliaceae bacterium]
MASATTALRVKELLREKGWTTKILAEKTGMSESYLTHIKNGTRRWNQDSLERLAVAFEISPLELFAQRRQRTDEVKSNITLPEKTEVDVRISITPIVGEIPSQPNAYNNQIMQLTTGCKDLFLPIINYNDPAMFALKLNSSIFSPTFEKNDILVISPEATTRSGDIAAVEYGNETPIKSIFKVTMTEDFVVLETINSKQSPVALLRGKDNFRIIGRVIERHQSFMA